MPQVPIQTSPTQQLSSEGQGYAQAPGVEPMRNYSGQQLEESGKTAEQLGGQMISMGARIQNAIDDSATKAADTKFTAMALDILRNPNGGFLNTAGVDAQNRFDATWERLVAAQKDVSEGLGNDIQKKMFGLVTANHLNTFRAQMDEHTFKQVSTYSQNETKARRNQYIQMAVANADSKDQTDEFGNATGAFNKYKATAIHETNDLADQLGLDRGSSQRKMMILETTSMITAGIVDDLSSNNKFTDAKKVLSEAWKNGEINQDSYDKLGKQIRAGALRQTAVDEGDKIYRDGKGINGSLQKMLKEVDKVAGDDKELGDMMKSRVASSYHRDENAKEEDYNRNVDYLRKQVANGKLDWTKIPAKTWAYLKPEDQNWLRNPTRSDDPNTELYLLMHPEEWEKGAIEKYRNNLSENTYQKFYVQGNSPTSKEAIRDATFDNDRFKDALLKTGLGDLLQAKKGSDEEKDLYDLRKKYKDALDSESQALNRKLKPEEKDQVLQQLIKPVKVKAQSSFWGIPLGSSEMDKRLYQVERPENIIIPSETLRKITSDLRARGIEPTEAIILGAYSKMKESEK